MAQKRIVTGDPAREGSRWIHERPAGEEVAEWFIANAKVDPQLNAADYVGGVVLIPSKDDVVIFKEDGSPEEVQRHVWTPYVKVETRVAYFWDLMALHEDWLGVIEPGRVPRVNLPAKSNEHLPPGFFLMPIQQEDQSWVQTLGCSMQARILKRSTVREVHGRLEGEPVIFAPPATKTTTLLGRYGRVDENAVEKAETGAVGRALGLANILVLPGSGVASAEDMVELLGTAGVAPANADGPAAELPADAPAQAPASSQKVGKDRILELVAELRELSEPDLETFQVWAREKGLNYEDLSDKDTRIVLRQLERKVTAARKKAPKPKPEAETDDGADAPSVPDQSEGPEDPEAAAAEQPAEPVEAPDA